MECPHCDGVKTIIKKTLTNDSGQQVRTRRCPKCGWRTKTVEIPIDEIPSWDWIRNMIDHIDVAVRELNNFHEFALQLRASRARLVRFGKMLPQARVATKRFLWECGEALQAAGDGELLDYSVLTGKRKPDPTDNQSDDPFS